MYYGECLLFGSRATSVRVMSIKLINKCYLSLLGSYRWYPSYHISVLVRSRGIDVL